MNSSQGLAPGASDSGGMEIRQYLDVLRKRRSMIALVALGVFVCVAVIASRMPNIYRSETVILVDAQQVPSDYVATTVTTSIQDRLSTIQQQVMSPTRLEKVIDRLNLYKDLRGKVSTQVLVQRVQKSTSVDVVNRGSGRLSSFRIAFEGENPAEVAQVANELADTFIKENLKVREQQFVGTAEFLDNELQDTKAKLETKEHQLQAIKSTYAMDLPESKQYHIEALNNLRSQLMASQDRVSRAQQDKVILQTMQRNSAPTIDLDAPGTGAKSVSALQTQIQKLEAHLADLQTRYGPNFPDVRKAQAELDRLKKKAATEEAPRPVQAQDTPASPVNKKNPVLDAQMQKLNHEIEEQTKLQSELQKETDFHIGKLERVPVFEQQILGLMRDYDALRAHYQSLLDKKLSAQMASELEERQKGERFVVLDPAPVPERPYSPNRGLITFAGLVLGVLAGFGLAVGVEVLDTTVRNEHEACQLAGVPVLAGIPRIYTAAQLRTQKFRLALMTMATASGSVLLGMAISFVTKRMGF